MTRLAIIITALAITVSACGADHAAESTAAVAAPAATAKPAVEQPRAQAPSDRDKLRTLSAAALAREAQDSTPQAMTRDAAEKTADKGPADAMPEVDAASAAALVARGDQAFKAGTDYVVLSPAQRTSSPPEKVEIAEVFMYQCPHCFSFEPFVQKMIESQPPQVNVVRLPAVFNNVAELHAKAFYAAQTLGVWEQLHTPFFREIHTRRNLMPTEAKLLDFIASQGIDRDAFGAAMKSFEVDSKVRDARDLNARYRIDSVPTVVINGKYVTSASLVNSTDKLKDVIDYLVAKETLEL